MKAVCWLLVVQHPFVGLLHCGCGIMYWEVVLRTITADRSFFFVTPLRIPDYADSDERVEKERGATCKQVLVRLTRLQSYTVTVAYSTR